MLSSIPFTPFIPVLEPAVFSRRTSVAWQTRALTDVGYQFKARQARSKPAREKIPRIKECRLLLYAAWLVVVVGANYRWLPVQTTSVAPQTIAYRHRVFANNSIHSILSIHRTHHVCSIANSCVPHRVVCPNWLAAA